MQGMRDEVKSDGTQIGPPEWIRQARIGGDAPRATSAAADAMFNTLAQELVRQVRWLDTTLDRFTAVDGDAGPPDTGASVIALLQIARLGLERVTLRVRAFADLMGIEVPR